jgi:hypothetical protein
MSGVFGESYGDNPFVDYDNPATPHLMALQQREEEDYEDPIIEVPVKVTEFCAEPLNVHPLPARECSMRNYVLSAGTKVQILGRDLRRSRVKVWAVTEGATAANILIGTDLAEVEQGTAALLPVMIDDLSVAAPFVLAMSHTKEMWVRNTHTDPVTVSVVSEYWAD